MGFVDIFLKSFSWRIPLDPFAVLPLGDPWQTPLEPFLFQPLRGPSPFFVALRGYLLEMPWRPWRIPLESFPTPSPWISFCLFRPMADPSRASSNPFVALRCSSWPFVDIFLPFPGNPFSPWRPMADPSRASSNPLVALRCSSWPFVDIFLPFPGNPFSPWRSLADPSRASSNPFVALSGPSCPFVDNSFSLRALRGSPSWISFFGLRHSLARSSTGPSQDPAGRLISARQSTSPSM